MMEARMRAFGIASLIVCAGACSKPPPSCTDDSCHYLANLSQTAGSLDDGTAMMTASFDGPIILDFGGAIAELSLSTGDITATYDATLPHSESLLDGKLKLTFGVQV